MTLTLGYSQSEFFCQDKTFGDDQKFDNNPKWICEIGLYISSKKTNIKDR